MNLFLFAAQLLNGLLDGFYYLLIALGLSLIFSLGGIVNLAHGAFYAIWALGYLGVETPQGTLVREARESFLEQNIWSFKYQKREL